MEILSILPQQLINYIYEYNPEHREKMHWSLHSIRHSQFCEVCDKIIMKYVWSSRRGDEVCCSGKCLGNYVGCLHYYSKQKWWI